MHPHALTDAPTTQRRIQPGTARTQSVDGHDQIAGRQPRLLRRAALLLALAVVSTPALAAPPTDGMRTMFPVFAKVAGIDAEKVRWIDIPIEKKDQALLASGVYLYAPFVPSGLDLETQLKAGELLYYKDGAPATVSVKRLTGTTTLAVDGKTDASNRSDHCRFVRHHTDTMSRPMGEGKWL